MPWIESHTELRDHPKTKRLARLLDCSIAQAVGHLHLLWWWVMDYAPDGDLTGYSIDDLADAGGWEGDPAIFVGSLVDCRVRRTAGFLERDEAGELHVHDWWKYGGKLYEERERRATHAKEMRQARKGNVTLTEPSRDGTNADAVPTRDPLEERRGEERRGEESTGEESTQENKTMAALPAPRTCKPRTVSPKAIKAEVTREPKEDFVFDAFVRNQKWDPARLSKNDRGQINYAKKALADAKPTPEEIDLAYDIYPILFKDCAITPPAIAKHFSSLMAEARRKGLRAQRFEPTILDEPEETPEPLPPLPSLPDDPPQTNGKINYSQMTLEERQAYYEHTTALNSGPWRGHDA